jgi:hypothetical protein
MAVVSLQGQIERVCGLPDKDLTEWERGFLAGLQEKVQGRGGSTSWMSEKQVAIIERIYNKHFAG